MKPNLTSTTYLLNSKPFQLGSWTVTPDKRLITNNQIQHTIEKRLMEVLCYLNLQRGRAVSVHELITEVWQGRQVGNHSVYRVVNQLRRLLHVDSEEEILCTVSGKGYMLKLIEDISELKNPAEIEETKKNIRPFNKNIPPPPKKRGLQLTKIINLIAWSFAISFFLFTKLESRPPLEQNSNNNDHKETASVFELNSNYHFNGNGDSISIKNNELIDLARSDFTIEALIKTEQKNATIMDKRIVDDQYVGYLIFIYQGQLLFQIATPEAHWINITPYDQVSKDNIDHIFEKPNNDSTQIYHEIAINDNQWHHVVASVIRNEKNTSVSLYVDGIKTMTKFPPNIGSISNHAPLLIGAHQEGIFPFEGSISKILITKKSKNEDEIATSYAQFMAKKCDQCVRSFNLARIRKKQSSNIEK